MASSSTVVGSIGRHSLQVDGSTHNTMANSHHVEAARRGAGSIAAYRKNLSDVEFDLSGADLTNCNLQGADLRNAVLNDVDLRDANLENADLDGADLSNAKLGGANLSNATLRGATCNRANLASATLNNANLSNVAIDHANLCQCIARNANFGQASLQGTSCERADFYQANFSGADLKGTNFAHVDLTTVILGDARLENSRMHQATFGRLTLSKAVIKASDFSQANLSNVDLKGRDLKGCVFHTADLSGADLTNSVLASVDFRHAILTKALFVSSDLTGAKLDSANLACADLTNCKTSGSTRWDDVVLDDALMSKRLAVILEASGHVTKAQIASMHISDPLRSLRASYGGFNRVLHVAFLLTFVAPYAAFIVRCLVMRKWFGGRDKDTIPMLLALIRYLWSGGEDLSESASFNFWAVATFSYLLLYNATRGWLLWKLMQFELEEQITGIPPETDPKGFLATVIRANRLLFLFSIACLIAHTLNFLSLPVPAK